jgi:ribose transport system substrate-binding protein
MKKFIALFLVLVIGLSLVACGDTQTKAPATETGTSTGTATPAPAAEKPLTVGIFVKDNTNPFWRYVVKGAMKAGEDLGVKVVEYTPAEASNVEQQVSLVQDAIQSGIDGMAIVAVDSAALLDACKQAKEKGITVVPFNSRMDDLGAATFVGIDNYTAMHALMEELMKRLDHKGNVVILEGVLAGYANKERMRAINDVLAANPDVKVVADQSANAQREEAITVMENILQANDKIDAVIGHNDNTILGAYQAILDAGRVGEMILTGFDAQEEALRYMASNDPRIDMTVDQSPFMQGYSSIEACVKLLRGETVDSYIPTGGTLVTPDNAQEILDKFYSK